MNKLLHYYKTIVWVLMTPYYDLKRYRYRIKQNDKIRHHDYDFLAYGGGNYGTMLQNAIDTFVPPQMRANKEYLADLEQDINESFIKYRALPKDYFLFSFEGKDHSYRASFITDTFKDAILCKITGFDLYKSDLSDKYNFFLLTRNFFNREVLKLDSTTNYTEFREFVCQVKKLFIKPLSGSYGNGTFVEEISTEKDAKLLYDKLTEEKSEWLIEERIIQSKEFEEWNASSVNTLRVRSFLTKKGFYMMPATFRVGRKGMIIDNAGAGGVFGNVNPSTGTVYTDGMDENGRLYKKHPDSGKIFKGYKIPQWEELCKIVEEVHRSMPTHIYIGWDFALSNKGWSLIEGNWGQFMIQAADKIGRKKEFEKYMKEGALMSRKTIYR